MPLNGITIGDDILTAQVTSAAYAIMSVPTHWQTAGHDILQFELWSPNDMTIGYTATEGEGVAVAADTHVVVAVRRLVKKGDTTIPGLYLKSAGTIHVLASRVGHAYADMG